MYVQTTVTYVESDTHGEGSWENDYPLSYAANIAPHEHVRNSPSRDPSSSVRRDGNEQDDRITREEMSFGLYGLFYGNDNSVSRQHK